MLKQHRGPRGPSEKIQCGCVAQYVQGGTRTEQGSRRARPGLDSDQAACLHRIPRCSFGTRKLKQSSLEALAAMLRSGGGTWTTASKAIFPLVNGKSCLEWKNGCTSLFALSSKTNLNMICSKISQSGAVCWELAVRSLQCAQLPWQLEPLNVNSRHHHTIQIIANKLNNLVPLPAGTNDTEADQRGAS